jgi:integrase
LTPFELAVVSLTCGESSKKPSKKHGETLRHGYAALLIAEWLDVAFVSYQLGPASPAITLGVYAHVFAQREHGEVARQALDAGYAAMTRESSG